MARSILSLGTDCFLALVTATSNPGLPSRSAPPARAATSIALMWLAYILARLASSAAFLCRVVCHFECPSTVENYSPVLIHGLSGSICFNYYRCILTNEHT